MTGLLRHSAATYERSLLSFYGPEEGEVRCRSIRLVKVRSRHTCGSCDRDLLPRDHAVCERANVEGIWCSAWTCIPCLDDWIAEMQGVEP